MKSKRKFDPKIIQQFFSDHTEKLVIGLVGLLFLYFAYSAVTLQINESFKETPATLADATTKAQNVMQRGPVGKTPDKETEIDPYADQIDNFKKALDSKKYNFPRPLNCNVISQPHLRPTPDVVPVMELRAVAGRGALGSREAANNGSAGQRWVLVTGLVPNHAQGAEFRNKFKNAADDSYTEPTYIGFLIQRAEVQPGAVGEPAWDNAVTFVCTETTFTNQKEKWSGMGSEVVDVQETLPCLTSPLPPRIVGEWGDEAAHLPEIKPMPAEERGQGAGPMTPGGRGGQFGPGRSEGPGVRGPGPSPHGPGPRTMPGRGGGEPIGPTPRPGGSGAGLGEDLLGNGAAKEEPGKTTTEPTVQTPKNYLLRYLDYDVQPGKQYAYRVFAVVRNPNFGLAEGVLMDPNQAKIPYLDLVKGSPADTSGKVTGWGPTDAKYWSPSCQSQRLPGDLRLMAGAVEPPKTPMPLEPTAEARILRWDEQTGFNSNYAPSNQFRGTTLNYSDAKVIVPGDTTRLQIPHLDTNCVLVDLAGGEALTPRDRDKVHSPGAMLVLDETGNLVMHDEMSETKEWVAETKPPDRPGLGGRGGRGFEEMAPGPRPGGTRRGAPGQNPNMPDFGAPPGRSRRFE